MEVHHSGLAPKNQGRGADVRWMEEKKASNWCQEPNKEEKHERVPRRIKLLCLQSSYSC